MSSPSSSPVRIDSSEIHHAPVAAGLSSLQYQQNTETLSQPSIETLQQPITCKLAQSDIVEIALQLKEMIHGEIDYTIKATVNQYKSEIDRLAKENQKLRDDLDALEQYGRRDLIRVNGIPDGRIEETSTKTTELVTVMLKSIDNELAPGDVIRAHRIGRPYNPEDAVENRAKYVSKRPRQIIVKLQDHVVKKRILRFKKHIKEKRDLKYITRT
ncbi:unnamed protein product [Mytilus coruscus]|uniref:Uncharacterized protein n=1 Tax=Mytilus coruscus TaxID=42192 RepID=A0A6J8CZ20_MYTCO|nr:unnamed protein product [Mytilus coruscus]